MQDHVNINLTSLISAVLIEFLKPYNDLLSEMARDGRVTKEELALLRQQTKEIGESLADRLRDHHVSL